MKIHNKILATLLGISLGMHAAFGETIKRVDVKGGVRVDTEVVKSYLRSNVGDAYDPLLINTDLKNLFASGLFSSVSFTFQNGVLSLNVIENPILNEIAFEGLSAFPEDILKKETHLESRQVFKKSDVVKAIDVILKAYQSKGYFSAKVKAQTIDRPENRVDLIFNIEEGSPTNIQKIHIVGNENFEAVDLRSVLDSQETGAFSFFQTTNVYDPNRVRVDEEKLRRFYLKNGFYDFKVKRSTAELLPNYEGFHLTYQLQEGLQYKIGKVVVQNPHGELVVEDLIAQVGFAEGSVFDQEAVEKSLDALNDFYALKGYPFVEITPDFIKDEKTGVINITYKVVPSKKVFVEKIVILGNNLTRENLIRNQLLFSEGDPFNPLLLRRSIKNLRNLGLFEPFIATDKRPGTAHDKITLVLRVSERPFFSIMGGGSYGRKQGFAANLNVSHRNIKGTGVAAQFQGVLGENTQSLNFNTMKPSIAKDLDFSLALSFRKDQDQEYSSYREESVMLSPTFTINWNEDFRTAIDYTFRGFDTGFFKDADKDKHDLRYGDREEKGIKSAAGLRFIYDNRDDRFTPTDGLKVVLGGEFAGIGGDVSYVKLDAAADYYIPFGRSGMVLALKGNAGTMLEVGDKYINFFERYRLGYLSFRGFQVAGVGPREKLAEKSGAFGNKNQFAGGGLGGLNMYKVTTEFSFPFAPDIGVRALTFFDMGSVWGLGSPKPDKAGDDARLLGKDEGGALRLSVGAGVQVDLPVFGRIVVGVATPLIKKQYDEAEYWFFSLGGGM